MRISLFLWIWSVVVIGFAVSGCRDAGTDPPLQPQIAAIVPDSAAVGDTIRIVGKGFGGTQGSSSVTIGGRLATTILSWSDTEIRAVVPSGVTGGTVVVTVGGVASNNFSFRLLGSTPLTVSFQTDIYPVLSLSSYGCSSCHSGGGSIGWYVAGNASATRSNLVNVNAATGSCTNLKRVLPGNANQSALYLRLAGTTCGDRMPQGGNPISTDHRNLIGRWIDQGAVE
jgi:hypothetical protein